MQRQRIRRHISWYSKEDDEFIADENMLNVELSSLQKLFQVETENPMYDCWEVKEQHVKTLQKQIKHIINIKKYDYFVEATLIDEEI